MSKWGAIAAIGIALSFASCQAYEIRQFELTKQEYIKNGYVYKQLGRFNYGWAK